MEPFGLFHFLQTLLSQNGATAPTEPKNEPFPESAPQKKAEETTPLEETITPSQEAALDFLYRHELYAKRRKKK